jgi:hypothetical protein
LGWRLTRQPPDLNQKPQSARELAGLSEPSKTFGCFVLNRRVRRLLLGWRLTRQPPDLNQKPQSARELAGLSEPSKTFGCFVLNRRRYELKTSGVQASHALKRERHWHSVCSCTRTRTGELPASGRAARDNRHSLSCIALPCWCLTFMLEAPGRIRGPNCGLAYALRTLECGQSDA